MQEKYKNNLHSIKIPISSNKEDIQIHSKAKWNIYERTQFNECSARKPLRLNASSVKGSRHHRRVLPLSCISAWNLPRPCTRVLPTASLWLNLATSITSSYRKTKRAYCFHEGCCTDDENGEVRLLSILMWTHLLYFLFIRFYCRISTAKENGR